MIKNIWKPIGQLYFNVFLNPLKFNGTLVITQYKLGCKDTKNNLQKGFLIIIPIQIHQFYFDLTVSLIILNLIF